MDLLEIMKHRRSVRVYTGESVPQEKLERIIDAGLVPAIGKGIRSWELIVVTDPETIRALKGARQGGVKMMETAGAVIAVIADSSKVDTWVEDTSLVMGNLHLMADAEGLGSCWVQCRMRTADDGRTSDEFVRSILGYPENYTVEAMLAMGPVKEHPAPRDPAERRECVHYGKF